MWIDGFNQLSSCPTPRRLHCKHCSALAEVPCQGDVRVAHQHLFSSWKVGKNTSIPSADHKFIRFPWCNLNKLWLELEVLSAIGICVFFVGLDEKVCEDGLHQLGVSNRALERPACHQNKFEVSCTKWAPSPVISRGP